MYFKDVDKFPLNQGPKMRERIVDLFERFYPDYGGEDRLFRSQVEDCLLDASVLLDAGCGSGRMAGHDFRQSNRMILGIDVDSDIKENATLTRAVRGRLVDLILCRYV